MAAAWGPWSCMAVAAARLSPVRRTHGREMLCRLALLYPPSDGGPGAAGREGGAGGGGSWQVSR